MIGRTGISASHLSNSKRAKGVPNPLRRPYGDARTYEERQRATLLIVLMIAVTPAAFYFALQNFLAGQQLSAIALGLMTASCLFGLWLVYTYRFGPAAMIFALCALSVIDFTLFDGSSLHDPGILTFPIYIVACAFLFGKKGLVAAATASIISVVALYFLEPYHRVPLTILSSPARVFAVSIFLLVIAIFTSIVRDTWESNLREVQLGRSELEKLSRKLLGLQEEERRSLARELHDEIGQALTAVKITLQSARTGEASPDRSAIDRAIEIVQRSLDQTRNLSLNLRPSVLDDLGLVPALRWLLDRQAGLNGWFTQFSAEPTLARLPTIVEVTCFRVAQEALTNVARHAQARRVQVDVSLEGAALLQLVVRDDGIGFDVPAAFASAAAGKSLGLLGMHERATLARGHIGITSKPGKGTEIRASFPLDQGLT
jgi:signal transduction histidine kinase